MLILTLGKTYRTRSGATVTIKRIDIGERYPCYGEITGPDGKYERQAYFSFNGHYNLDRASTPFDIVSEVAA